MCYGFYAVHDPDAQRVDWILREAFFRLYQEGKIAPSGDGFIYAKAQVGAIHHRDGDLRVLPMRWDLIPRGFMAGEPQLSLAEVIRKKNSRARNPETLKPWGFDSFNARKETVDRLWSFRLPWREGKRCALPVNKFRERPNMDGAPAEYRGFREFNLSLEGEQLYLAGLWDRWERKGEGIDSCTVITLDSSGNDKLRGIWHERCPVILDGQDQVEEWLDPKTTLSRAMEMCRLFPARRMTVEEVFRPKKA